MVGLPGVGKTTLARNLRRLMDGLVIYESDAVRKALAGYPPDIPLPKHMYSPEMNERTFAHIRERTTQELRNGRSVLVDATFLREEYRRPFVDIAIEVGVPVLAIHVFAPEEVVRRRLERPRGTSDANYEVYLRMREEAQLPPDEIPHISVDGTQDPRATAILVRTWIRGLLRAL